MMHLESMPLFCNTLNYQTGPQFSYGEGDSIWHAGSIIVRNGDGRLSSILHCIPWII